MCVCVRLALHMYQKQAEVALEALKPLHMLCVYCVLCVCVCTNMCVCVFVCVDAERKSILVPPATVPSHSAENWLVLIFHCV